MAGTVTSTDRKDNPNSNSLAVRSYKWSWTSDGSGNVSGTVSERINGAILRVSFVPGSGASAPSAGYDVTLLDENGIDVLGGQGGNLSATDASDACPGVPLGDGTTTSTVPTVINDTLELRVTNAGDSNSGTVTIYVR